MSTGRRKRLSSSCKDFTGRCKTILLLWKVVPAAAGWPDDLPDESTLNPGRTNPPPRHGNTEKIRPSDQLVIGPSERLKLSDQPITPSPTAGSHGSPCLR